MISTLDLGDQLADLFGQYTAGSGLVHFSTELVNDVGVITFRRMGGAPLTDDVFEIYLKDRARTRQVRASWEIACPAMAQLRHGLDERGQHLFASTIDTIQYGSAPQVRPFEFKPSLIEDAAKFCEGVYLPKAEAFFLDYSTVDSIERVVRENFEEPAPPGRPKKNILIEQFILYCLTIGDDARADRANRDLVQSGQDQNFDFQGYLNSTFPDRLSSVEGQ